MSEYYWELVVTPHKHYKLFLDFLLSFYKDGFEEKDNTLVIRSEENLEDLKWVFELYAQKLQDKLGEPIELGLSLEQKKNEDWINKYKNSIEPVLIDNFYIYPSWNEPKEGCVNIKIDPALAFGSGHHPTTATCLKAIGQHVKNQDTFLDVGCGSGILSIAAAKLGAVIDCCDTDEQCIQSTEENFKLNDAVFNKHWVGSVTIAKQQYDVVVANIVADVLIFIAKDLKQAVKDGKLLILSGIINKYEEKVQKAFSNLTLIDRIQVGDWISLVYKKEQ